MDTLRRTILLVPLGLLMACGAPPPAATTSRPVSLPVASDTGRSEALATKGNCTDPPLATARDREHGIDAFLADRPDDALVHLAAAVTADPRDRAAEAFRQASLAKLEESQAHATDRAGSLRRVTLEALPLAAVHHRDVEGVPQARVHLEKVSETKNLITDGADWETKNQLTRTTRRGGGTLPASLPPSLQGQRLQTTFVHADHIAAVYGSTILVASDGERALAFDARTATTSAPRPLEVTFVQLVGRAIVVGLAYNGYAKESGGKNGYVAAYEVATGRLLWATDPLTANANEAVISGGSIVTGYGFTAEPDFLFVLDLANGKVTQKLPLKSGPSAIRAKGDRVFVRSYDVDYVFKSTTGLAPSPPAGLRREAGAATSVIDAETRCWVQRATASIGSRDADGLREATARLKSLSRDRVLDEMLQLEARKLGMSRRLDLTAAPLVVVAAPPWQATTNASPTKPAREPTLVKISSRAASPTRNMDAPFDPTKPFFIAPVDKGRIPEAARADTPSSYGQEDLRAIIPDQRPNHPRSILVYGGRYLALLAGDVAERVFDLELLRHPPKANPQWKEFAIQDVTYAQERDNVLYVCNGGGSYAKEVYGKKGFMTALDAMTGKLLWRSAPLTCNATFVVTGDHLITGYGFTDEPDFVFLLRRADGSVAQKVPVDSGPQTITLTGQQVHVETYGSVADFALR